MKKHLLLFALLILLISIQSHAQNTWTKMANVPGGFRTQAAGFSIGNKGYIGTGFYVPNSGANDFWEYDFTTNTWTQKANVGSLKRYGAVGFSIGDKGYIGTGANIKGGLITYLKDFWEYDPELNTWTEKADFQGSPRGFTVGFSINGKGYIGTGYGAAKGQALSFDNDFYQYDPSANTWTRKEDFGGTARIASGFTIGNKGYIGTGYYFVGSDITVYADFWQYNPTQNQWKRKADFGGGSRGLTSGFSLMGKGYLGTGIDANNNEYKDFWEYDPVMNKWSKKTDYPGMATISIVGFSVGNYGYLGTGQGIELTGSNEFWQYTPDGAPKEIQKDADFDCTLFPNPGNGKISLQANLENGAHYLIKVFNEEGQLKLEMQGENSNGNFSKELDLTSFPSGSYVLQLIYDGQCETKESTIQN